MTDSSEVETRDLDAAPVNPLDTMFRLPDSLRDDETWQPIFDQMTAQLRREAAGIQMSTLQYILIERIASGYVLIRHREMTDSWVGVNTEKETKAEWRNLVIEFNRLLANGEDKRREQLIDDMEKIILGGLELIDDSETKKRLRRYYEGELAAIGQ